MIFRITALSYFGAFKAIGFFKGRKKKLMSLYTGSVFKHDLILLAFGKNLLKT